MYAALLEAAREYSGVNTEQEPYLIGCVNSEDCSVSKSVQRAESASYMRV
jgi:hypothetical protein